MTKLLSTRYFSKHNHRGFTLLELVIVITVLGILLVLGAVAYRGITESAQNTAIMNDIKVLEDAAELADAKGLSILGEEAGLPEDANVRNQKGEVVDPDDAEHVLYTINAANVGQYTKRLKYPIENYLIDNKKLVYYKGTFAGETVAAASPTATPTPTPAYGSNNPKIPAGFTHTMGTWNTGYVVEDASGNEFVWVPSEDPDVGGIKKHTEFHNPVGNYYWQVSMSDDANNAVDGDNIAAVKSRIEAAGGFYIARYEMSQNGSFAQSKPNQAPWISINWTDSRTRAEGMKTDYGYDSSIDTHLIYGAEWDTTVYWLRQTNAISAAELIDGRTWGNYPDDTIGISGTPANTGSNISCMKNNIYDLCGNVWEWSMEMENGYTTHRVYRGGSYNNNGTINPVVSRFLDLSSNTCSYIGYRAVVLP